MSAEMVVWLRNCLCLYSRCECHTYGCLPSCRASPPLDWCQIILLGDRGTCVWTTCPRLLTDSGMAWTSELRDHRCDHYTARPHPVAYCQIYILLLYYCEPSHVTFGIMSNSTGCGSNCKEYLRPVVFWSMTYYTSLTDRQEMMGFWDALKISWTICKQSAPRSRRIPTPASHHTIFTVYRPDALRDAQSTVSKHWWQLNYDILVG